MGISIINGASGISGGQQAVSRTQQVDIVGKRIQSEIESIQRQKQELSSREDIPTEERSKMRQELQQEISRLNVELRQHQAEMRKEQQRKAAAEEARTDKSGAKEAEEAKAAGKTDAAADNARNTGTKTSDTGETGANAKDAEKVSQTKAAAADTGKSSADVNGVGSAGIQAQEIGIPQTQMQKMLALDSAMEQTKAQSSILSKMESGVVILKGEIRQDEISGADTEKKQAQLEQQENKVRKASSYRISPMNGSLKPVKEAMQAKTGEQGRSVGVDAVRNHEDKVLLKAVIA